MKEPSSKTQIHVFDLPGVGRLVYRLQFAETDISAVLESPGTIHRRRDRRTFSRWLDKIQRPIKADPRPMHITTLVAGKLASLAVEASGGIFVFGEGMP